MKLEDAREGADVISRDGHKVGKLSRVVIKEESLEITHLVVDPGLLHSGESLWAGGWGQPHERVIPVGVLEDEAESPADHGVVIGEDNPNRASDEHALHGYIVGRWGRDLYLG